MARQKKSLSLPLTVVVKLDEQGNGRRKILHSLESSLGPFFLSHAVKERRMQS